MASINTLTSERAELLEVLTTHRGFLIFTAQGLTDEQAAATPTASELPIGGLIKHVAHVERGWVNFILDGASALAPDPNSFEAHANSFRMLPGETLESLLKEYETVAARTDEVVHTVDLDASHALPDAPWFEPGKTWSARRVLMHIALETAQHAGHADILRETIDGQKTMG